MILAGVTNSGNKARTVSLINSILSSSGKKISVVDSKNLMELASGTVLSYMSELAHSGTEVLLLKINLTDLKNYLFDHLSFDMMIFSERSVDTEDAYSVKLNFLWDRLNMLLSEKGTAIVNIDDTELVKIMNERGITTITYGFNTKANITTSSIGDMVFQKEFLCCLQKPVTAVNGLLVHPQEYRVNLDSPDMDVNDAMAAATFAIVNGEDLMALSH